MRSDNTVYQQLDLDLGPDEVTPDRLRHGHHDPPRRLPGRGPRRPAHRRLAAGDGPRLRDDRHRRLPQPRRSRSPRSSSPTARSTRSTGSRTARRSSPTARRWRPSRRWRPTRSAAPAPRRSSAALGRRQDRHHRRLHRRVVRRHVPSLTTAVWVGYPKTTASMYAVPRHRGLRRHRSRPRSGTTSCRRSSRSASDRGRRRRSRSSRSRSSAATRRPARPAAASDTGTLRLAADRHAAGRRHDTATGTPQGTGGQKYPPDQYASPPQPAPQTQPPPPASGGTAPATATPAASAAPRRPATG